jgi:hypothetical protein
LITPKKYKHCAKQASLGKTKCKITDGVDIHQDKEDLNELFVVLEYRIYNTKADLNNFIIFLDTPWDLVFAQHYNMSF